MKDPNGGKRHKKKQLNLRKTTNPWKVIIFSIVRKLRK